MSASFSGESFRFTQDNIRFPFSSGSLLAEFCVLKDLDVAAIFLWITFFVFGVANLTRGERGEGGGNEVTSICSLLPFPLKMTD